MKTSTRIALLQMNSGDAVAANLTAAAEYLAQAKAGGARFAALPECFALMPRDRQQLRAAAEAFGDGEIQNFLRDRAAELEMWILAGSLPLQSDDPARVFNSSLVYDDRGAVRARYDKIHLFDAAITAGETHTESAYTAAGDRCVVVETPLGKLGLSVCYDLRFPELYRELAAQGAVGLAVPSAFTAVTGAAHWETLLRARAIENSCALIAPAQVGAHSSARSTYGHSMAVDAWGKIIAQRAATPGVEFADIDAAATQRARAQLPSLRHRRAAIFR